MLVRPCGEQAVIVDITDSDAEEAGTTVLHTVLKLQQLVTSWQLPGIVDLIPASQTLLIMLDTTTLLPRDLEARLLAADLSSTAALDSDGELVEVPVRYDGPDLTSLAELLHWSPEELVRRHTETTWTVAFGGFAPGFSYLVAEHPLPSVPRLSSPRTSIPAGSVGLAGEFSGVYPQQSPGGWQIIGTTDIKMWDPTRTQRPAYLRPGDSVRFWEVS